MTPVSICVLIYGDYLDLAQRVLNSLDGFLEIPDVNLIVAMNEPSDRVRRFVVEKYELHPDVSGRVAVVQNSNPKVHKYPMMRYVLYDANLVKPNSIFIWFDDDSYVKTSVGEMIADVRSALAKYGGLVGATYLYSRLQKYQLDWFRRQPWYTGKEIKERSQPFITGGWWACYASLLRRYDWPTPELDHNGGDIALGVLCDQQDIPLINSHRHVAVNASTSGRDSSSVRRGYSGPLLGHPNAPAPVRFGVTGG